MPMLACLLAVTAATASAAPSKSKAPSTTPPPAAVAAPAPPPSPPPPQPSPPSPPPPSTTTTTTTTTRPLRVAVYHLDGTGLDPALTRFVEQSLLAEVRKLQRVSVISLDEVKALLDVEATKQLTGCSEQSCLAEIGEALGADVLVTGGMVALGTNLSVSWKRISSADASVTQSFTQTLAQGDGTELLAVVGPGVATLFPDVPLRAGQTRGVAPEVAARLNPPPLAPWIFITSASAAAVVGGAGVVAAATAVANNDTLQATYATAQKTPVPSATVTSQQRAVDDASLAAAVLGGVAGAVAIGSLFLLPFTDWQGAPAGSSE